MIVLVFLRSFRWSLAGPFDLPSEEVSRLAGQFEVPSDGTKVGGLTNVNMVVEGGVGEDGGVGEQWGEEWTVDMDENEAEEEDEDEDEDEDEAEDDEEGVFQCDLYLAQSLVPGLGRGVFAGRSFRQDEVIDRAPSMHVPHDYITNTQVTIPLPILTIPLPILPHPTRPLIIPSYRPPLPLLHPLPPPTHHPPSLFPLSSHPSLITIHSSPSPPTLFHRTLLSPPPPPHTHTLCIDTHCLLRSWVTMYSRLMFQETLTYRWVAPTHPSTPQTPPYLTFNSQSN